MATPMVTGAAALLNSVRDETFLEVKERILRGVDRLESLYGRVLSNGRLNVYKSLTADLSGPFIFSISPIGASPGSTVTIEGVRFGDGESGSRVTFDGVEAFVEEWTDTRIRCRVPEGSMNSEIKVHIGNQASNGVLFSIVSIYRYYLPFAPASPPWVSHLVLTNLHDRTVKIKVNASEAGAFTLDSFPETLNPEQTLYRNIKEYGLKDEANILWVESDRDIRVGIVVSSSVGGLRDFSFIRALSP
jgi:hypothetical protein